jgi:hypothetical protein
MTLALAGAAAFAMVAPPPSVSDPEQPVPGSAAQTDPVAPPSVPLLSKEMDNIEVIAADPVGRNITVKIKGDEEVLPVPARLHATLRVVKPGDKVRIYYRQEEPDGQPRRVEGLVITKANHAADRETSSKDASKASPSDVLIPGAAA